MGGTARPTGTDRCFVGDGEWNMVWVNTDTMGHDMSPEEFRPGEVVGKPYHRGMLPFGGGISN